MQIVYRNTIAFILAIALFVLSGVNLSADEVFPFCEERNNTVVVAFMNGVGNTFEQASDSRRALEKFYGSKTPSGDKIQYELLYNETAGFINDLIEVFEQREVLEQYELILAAANKEGEWREQYRETDPSLFEFCAAFSRLQPLLKHKWLMSSLNNSPAYADYAVHRAKLDSWIAEGKKVLLAAHSQGNLFAVNLYDYAASRLGNPQYEVRVVHVAPPTSKLRGKYILAARDDVINLLRLDRDILPPTDNIADGIIDALTLTFAHGFVEIYINRYFVTSDRVKRYMSEALNELIPPDIVYDFDIDSTRYEGCNDIDNACYLMDTLLLYSGSISYYSNSYPAYAKNQRLTLKYYVAFYYYFSQRDYIVPSIVSHSGVNIWSYFGVLGGGYDCAYEGNSAGSNPFVVMPTINPVVLGQRIAASVASKSGSFISNVCINR